MGVDRGYGSGKPLSSAQSASRRAATSRAASRNKTIQTAAKKYGQKKGMYYTNPGMLASQKNRMNAESSRLSGNLLEGFTGFNKKDGVDAGDLAGLAISIPTGGIGGALLRAGARAVVPKAARIAAAATRVSRRSRRVLGNAERAIQDADWNINQGIIDRNFGNTRNQTVLGGNSNNYSFRGHGAFDENLGYDLTSHESGIGVREGETLVSRGLAKKEYSRGGDSWIYRPTGGDEFIQQGNARISKGEAAKRAAEIAARTAADRVSAAASAKEIRRRLTALRNAKEAERKAPKPRDLSKPLDWNDL